mgnify:CR=1 FL=1
MAGKYVVLEGMDNSGKTTQARLLAQALPALEFVVEPTKNTPIGNLIRQGLVRHELPIKIEGMRDAFLFFADRMGLHEHIRQQLAAGRHCLTDRTYHSTICYEGAMGVDIQFLANTADYLIKNGYLCKPDLVIILDISPEEFLRRNEAKPGDKFHAMEFQRKVRENYLALAGLLPHEKITVVNGAQSIEKVHADILSLVHSTIGS